MSVYLDGSSVLLDSGNVATDTACCCGGGGTGACCFNDGSCVEETAAQCSDDGGTYQGDGTLCVDFDCTHGACCTDDVCAITTFGDCGGVYHGAGSTCDPNPCPILGACCVTNDDCTRMSPSECADAGGNYRGDGTLCTECGGACCRTIRDTVGFTEKCCDVLPIGLSDNCVSDCPEGSDCVYQGDGSTCCTTPPDIGCCWNETNDCCFFVGDCLICPDSC